jgi:hypothetical protein
LGSLLLLAASLHAPTAYSAVGDPPTGSPAGAVYELPLERGRSDGAPSFGGGGSSGGGGAAGGAGSGEAASLYRSENNFGSSSRVPGIATAGVGAAAAGAAAGAAGGAGSAVGSGADSGSEGPGAAGALARGEVADAGNTSLSANIALLGAIALLALTLGVLTRRFGR